MHEMKLHFQRFEFKYFLTFEEFRDIRRRLAPYVSLDGFAKDSRSGFYEVISLYYDSPKFYYYHEKQDGVRNRKKIRLRRYEVDGRNTGPSFFEIKRKFDAVILKDRFLLDRDTEARFAATRRFTPSSVAGDANASHIIAEYDAERVRRSLEPKIVVRYRREPYLGRYNQNFRVTFDYHITASESSRLSHESAPRDVLPDGVIMELKFNGRLPRYIREIIESYSLERSAYSKYCKAAETCYLIPDVNNSRHCFFNVDAQLLSSPI